MTHQIIAQSPEAAQKAGTMDRSSLSWAIFEGGRNPYIILCTIYILAPYIATTVFPDPVQGQATIASWHKYGGFFVALTAPLLGSIADKLGHRKPALFIVTAAMVASIFSLWWALPAGQGGLPIWAIGVLTAGAGVLFAYNEVLHNSMLPVAASAESLPYVSGMGLALGNLASVGLLVFVLWGLAFPGRVDWPFIPKTPLFGLDPIHHETSRIVAPMAALWFALCAAPLFLFTKDAKPTGINLIKAGADGFTGLINAVKRLFKTDKNAGVFLLARMLYVDGKTAILIFGGLTAAGVFGWDILEMSAYGVILSIFAVLGGLFSGKLDAAIGARNSIIIEIGVTLACLLIMTSQSTTRIFGVDIAPGVRVWEGPMFNTLPELVFLGGAVIIAISITGAYASSRTLMARLAPKGMEGEFFGLYSLSGSATLWLGSMLVELFTSHFKSQQIGLASTGILLVAGVIVLLFVKQPPRLESGTY
jgi:MFS transporter, UMF1 family